MTCRCSAPPVELSDQLKAVPVVPIKTLSQLKRMTLVVLSGVEEYFSWYPTELSVHFNEY